MMFFEDPFLMFILFILVTVIFGPFGIYGMYHFYQWFSGWIKVRSGHIKVRQKLPNDRWRVFWKKPVGRKINIKTEEGMEVEVPIRLEKDFVGWEGSTPFIEIDENYQQMKLTRTTMEIPKEHATRMSYLAYLAGKIAGMKEENMLQLLLIIAIAAMFIGVGLTWFMNHNMQKQVSLLSQKLDLLENKTIIQGGVIPTTPIQIPQAG